MIVKTRNSTYRVTPYHTHFVVEKIAETSPNFHDIEVGWTRICKGVAIMVGYGATFGDNILGSTITSEVLEVYNESHEQSR